MNKEKGCFGELLATKYLIDQKYYILHRGYTTKIGEIDIIAQEKDVVIFIEVKTRTNDLFGLPREAITNKKKLTIKKIAMQYIVKRNMHNFDIRFDAIEVILSKNNHNIEHIKNAF